MGADKLSSAIVREKDHGQAWRDFLIAIKPNRGQFLLNMLLTMLIGVTVSVSQLEQAYMTGTDQNNNGKLDGSETGEFIVNSKLQSMQFLIIFGWSKAVTNLVVGMAADIFGRKPVMILGWLLGVVAPIMVILAPNWGTVLGSNVFLGIQQGAAWSLTIMLMVDFAGPAHRGLAVGLNELAGYVVIAIFTRLTAEMTDDSARNYREGPYYLVLACMIAGLGLSLTVLRDSKSVVVQEQLHRLKQHDLEWSQDAEVRWPSGKVSKTSVFQLAFVETTFLNRSLVACCQAGLMMNFLTSFAWGLSTKWLKTWGNAPHWNHFTAIQTSNVLLAYGLPKGVLEAPLGFLSDRWGRKYMVVAGMATCCLAMVVWALVGQYANSQDTALHGFYCAATILGIGTAAMYSTVIAAVAEHCDASWRASAVGTYRFWRDSGVAIGGWVLGTIAQEDTVLTAIMVTAVMCFISAVWFGLAYQESPEEKLDMVELSMLARASQKSLPAAVEAERAESAPAV